MVSVSFASHESFSRGESEYELAPFRFAKIPGITSKILATSEVGEYLFLKREDLEALVNGTLPAEAEVFNDLLAKHFLLPKKSKSSIRLLSTKYRTKKSFLRGGPALHIFVVTLRCDHSCQYCQVSRQSQNLERFDISEQAALAAIDRLFEAPSPALTVEFQGGEPLLAFEKIRFIVENIKERNLVAGRKISFVITSTLHHLDDEILEYCKTNEISLSTSLDGPAWLHNANRPAKDKNSHEKTIAGIERARAALGKDKVAALTTLTKLSLQHYKEIIDEYVRLDFRSIFLRPLSPYGFALRTEHKIGYNIADFIAFYDRSLDYILELNASGTVLDEAYTSILLRHILTPFPTGYVDLRSPMGAGLGAIVYNYDGSVYASDEGRMLAEMGETVFRMGDVYTPYAQLLRSPAIDLLLSTGVAEALPGCSDCAFLSYCGSDPVFNLSRQNDPIGHRPTNEFCSKQTGMFQILFRHLYEQKPQTMRTLMAWALNKSPAEIHPIGADS